MRPTRISLRILHCALCIAVAATRAAMADAYQYIITPGYDPAAASLAKTSEAVSSPVGFATGALSESGTPMALEARFRTWLEAIQRTKFNSFKVIGLFFTVR